MYAVDISTIHSRIYETKSESKQIKAVTDINVIHNQVRRYIFDLASIINGFRVEQGKQIICKSCGKALTSDMKLAWELKKCIFVESLFKTIFFKYLFYGGRNKLIAVYNI